MKRIEYIYGERLGTCSYVCELPIYIAYNGRRFRRAVFKCGYCDAEFEAMIMNVKGGNILSCGCLNRGILMARNHKHGLSDHHLYSTWKNIKARCLNPNHQDYKYYGGRGITVCDEWREDFKAFHDHVTRLPNYGEPGMTIDREENDEGYYPGNVRWADRVTQRHNQRKMKKVTL